MAESRPYRLRSLDGASPRPVAAITAPADCEELATDWLRSFCGLTLRSDWRLIVAPTDPFGDPSSASSVTWFATMARATIDGDTSLCSDVAMREWITFGHAMGGAPPPGATQPTVRPIAECLTYERTAASRGTFAVSDPTGQTTVEISVSQGAATAAGTGTAPPLDTKLVCPGPPPDRDLCSLLMEAVTLELGARAATVEGLAGRAYPLSCPTLASACPPPAGGRWLGSVLVDLEGSQALAFDVAVVGGGLVVAEAPFQP